MSDISRYGLQHVQFWLIYILWSPFGMCMTSVTWTMVSFVPICWYTSSRVTSAHVWCQNILRQLFQTVLFWFHASDPRSSRNTPRPAYEPDWYCEGTPGNCHTYQSRIPSLFSGRHTLMFERVIWRLGEKYRFSIWDPSSIPWEYNTKQRGDLQLAPVPWFRVLNKSVSGVCRVNIVFFPDVPM